MTEIKIAVAEEMGDQEDTAGEVQGVQTVRVIRSVGLVRMSVPLEASIEIVEEMIVVRNAVDIHVNHHIVI